MSSITATVFTHRRPAETGPAIRDLVRCAAEAGATLRFSAEETAKHALQPGPGLELDAPIAQSVDLCFALGGDGTILTALRTYPRDVATAAESHRRQTTATSG